MRPSEVRLPIYRGSLLPPALVKGSTDDNPVLMGFIPVFVGVPYEAVKVAAVLQFAAQLGERDDPSSYEISLKTTGEVISSTRVVGLGDDAIVLVRRAQFAGSPIIRKTPTKFASQGHSALDIVEDDRGDGMEITPDAASPSNRTKRKPTDPRKPKRKTARRFFDVARKEHLKGQNPGLNQKAINALLKSEWDALSKSERRKYKDMETEDRKRFDDEMTKYEEVEGRPPSPVPKKAKSEEKSAKKKKDPSAPKASNAYILFCKKERERGDYSGKDGMSRLRAQWKALSNAEKAPFETLVKKDKARYDAAMVAYKQKIADESLNLKATNMSLKRERSSGAKEHVSPPPLRRTRSSQKEDSSSDILR